MFENTQRITALSMVPSNSKGGKTRFRKIGAAFPTNGGAGLTVLLDAMPINGKIHLCEDRDDSVEAAEVESP